VAAALGIPPEDVLDLSMSLNPFAPDVTALAARHLDELRRYPDVETAERVAAEMIGVPAERFVLTAGGAQAIALTAEHLGAGWVDEPDFSLYRRHLPRLDPTAPHWRSDPHNPTGLLAERPDPPAAGGPNGVGRMPADHVRRDDEAVWDEAFLPLSAGSWTRGRPGWALGSLTKAFACPGLRLGYAIAPTDDDADALRRRRPAWAIGAIACAVLPELADAADPPAWTEQIAKARAATVDVLREHGFEPRPSDAPWLLVPNAGGLRDALAQQAVVVRDCSSFGLPDHVRIAVPDGDGLHRLDTALAKAATDGDLPGR
jgi:histidinol-phosphate/aromatic aminotransferase/cobyric acid decarboxylase-like protein